MSNLEYKRTVIQQKKLELIRELHELAGKNKANIFDYIHTKDEQKKQELLRTILRIKKKISINQAKVSEYNEFLNTGKINRATFGKGAVIDIKA